MRLSLICEILDNPSMDDVTILSHTKDLCEYEFVDPNLEGANVKYVVICESRVAPAHVYFRPDLTDAIGELTCLCVSLQAYTGNVFASPYDVTGIGNSWFVYNKLLACVFDYFDSFGVPPLAAFSAYKAKTLPIYQRMVKLLAKLNPKYEMVPYQFDPRTRELFYLSKEAFDLMKDRHEDISLLTSNTSNMLRDSIRDIKSSQG